MTSVTTTTGTTAAGDIRALADELHAFRLAEDPIAASAMGLRGFDAGVPDVSAAADARRRAVYSDLLDRTRTVAPAAADAADAITAACVLATVEAALAEIDAGAVEFTVSAAMGEGPAVALGLASRTKLSDEASARDWLSRVGGLTGYLDTVAERLRTGAAAGRTPVHTLVVTAVAQLDHLLAAGAPGPFLDPFAAVAPAGTGGDDGAGAPGWVAELSAAVATEVDARLWPALGRYRDLLRDELLPVARPDDACGLLNLDGGPAAYRALVRRHTTLPLSPEEIHQQGLADIEENHRRMLVIGGPQYGVDTVAGVLDALRRAGATPDPATAMVKARAAVRLAEAAAPAWFAPPAAPPCAVEPMAELLALAGMPPHYTPPSEDGTRVGTYWFNADRPGLGTGPEVESVTYHESVPGHHLQLVRMLSLTHIPALQRQTVVTAHCEGWGLYAEVLAQEMASTRTTRPCWGCWRRTPSAPAGSSWTRGSTPSAGPASRRSPSSPTRCPCPATPSRPRSTGTSACPGRRWRTRPASGRSSACGRQPSRSWATASTSAASTPRSWTPGASRCRRSRGPSRPGWSRFPRSRRRTVGRSDGQTVGRSRRVTGRCGPRGPRRPVTGPGDPVFGGPVPVSRLRTAAGPSHPS